MKTSKVQTCHAQKSVSTSSLLVVLLAAGTSAQWPQWGGPNRDFHSPATGLAEKWPEGGPTKLWERALGAGYSSIVADGGRLFTMYRSGNDEVVVALNAETGATEWEHKYTTAPDDPAPNSTPTLEGNALYTLGISGMLCALDKNSGKLIWSHDLVKEYRAKWPQYGFSASPLIYRESLIVPLGGAGFGAAAFALADGKLLWHQHDFEEIYASPVLIDVEGEAQVAIVMPERIVGLSPVTGELLWSETIGGEQNIATPVWSSDKLLCVTASMAGSVGLKFSKSDGKTKVERAWTNDKLHIPQTTVVRVGDYLYGSTGDPCVITAIHAKTGEVAWREPGFSLANFVAADGKLVLLDYEGVLGLATAGPKAGKVNSKVKLLGEQTFTGPTVSDKHVYLRDNKNIMALDLGKSS